jgi:hypothetical protein
LEHFDPDDGDFLLQELFRTCQQGGICRIVVPDYEQICKEYLRSIQAAIEKPSENSVRCYHWSVLEMIDQLVRDTCGGRMLETLLSGDFDEEYVMSRCGEEFTPFYTSDDSTGKHENRKKQEPRRGSSFRVKNREPRTWKEIPAYLLHRLHFWRTCSRKDPRKSGELHRWVYDRFGLKFHMGKSGFVEIAQTSHDTSRIPYWSSYLLDSTSDGLQPRKPDSLYMEGKKPVPLGNTDREESVAPSSNRR